MNTAKTNGFTIATLVLLACLTLPARGGNNIALGKQYLLEPPANYSHCTEPGDKTQLTDGIRSEGYFWTQKTTVGWQNAFPASVTIDLGTVSPIGGVSYNTAAGTAGVRWPTGILVMVSADGTSYHLVGDLVALDRQNGSPEADGYGLHRYWTDQLDSHGRFVKLLIATDGPFIFTDEIEVYGGEEHLLDIPLPGAPSQDVRDVFNRHVVADAVRRRLNSDLEAVRKTTTGIKGGENLARKLFALPPEIEKLRSVPANGFTTVFPINDLHGKIFRVQADVWRAMGCKGITIWKKNRWDMVHPTECPASDAARIDVAMMRNEFRSAAFNISNASTESASLSLLIRDLPGGTNPGFITVHDGRFTDTKSGVPVIAALPYAKRNHDGYQVDIAPGLTHQIWLTFHSKDTRPGQYTGTIVLEPQGLTVPVSLKVYPFRFPDEPTLQLGGWDYTNEERRLSVTPDNRSALIRHLREHFVDTPWATKSVLPYGTYDQTGNMTEEPDTSDLDAWIGRWPGARNYYVFAAVQPKFCGFATGTDPFRKSVGQWIQFWVNELQKRHIAPNRLGLLLVDEPHNHEQSNTIIEYSRVIQDAEPDVVIWEDPTWREPWQAPSELFTLGDTLCPNLPMWQREGRRFADFYVKQRDAGRRLSFYSCSGPGRLLDPYAYHRMQHWFCWKYDAGGSFFWAFGDSNGSSSWNEYLSKRGAYTPVFLDDRTVTPGKHMEAIREGIEDFEYLRMLRDRIADLERAGTSGTPIDSARTLLGSAADRVTACITDADAIQWAETKDRTVADEIRVEVLEALMRLKDL